MRTKEQDLFLMKEVQMNKIILLCSCILFISCMKFYRKDITFDRTLTLNSSIEVSRIPFVYNKFTITKTSYYLIDSIPSLKEISRKEYMELKDENIYTKTKVLYFITLIDSLPFIYQITEKEYEKIKYGDFFLGRQTDTLGW